MEIVDVHDRQRREYVEMKRNLIFALSLLVIASAAFGVMAQNGRGAGKANVPAQQGMACANYLGLSQAQLDQIKQLRTDFANNTADLRADLQARHQEIMKLWAVPEPDVELIKSKAAQADAVMAQMRNKSIDLHAATLNVLTTEQRAKCTQCCQSRQNVMGIGPGMGMGMCGMGGGCFMGTGAGTGMGMGPGAGKGMGSGADRGTGQGMGPNGAGCPFQK